VHERLEEQEQARDQLVTERRRAVMEDVQTRKEISHLKQKDVKDNQAREGNLHLLYKQQLAEKILQKKERAAHVREQ
jgi:hypothetical protein